MSAVVEPIEREGVSDFLRGFYSKRFRHEQLGKEGRWLGTEWTRHNLREPIQLNDLERLFQNVTSLCGYTLNPTNEPIGWRITFEAHRHESTFWALGSDDFKRRAEEVVIAGVEGAARYMDEKFLGGILRACH